MAEGIAPLNRQVVETDYWMRSERIEVCPPSAPILDRLERDRRRADVRRAIEADIVPRVFLRREPAAIGEAAPGASATIGADEVVGFARLLLRHEDDGIVMARLEALQARGVPIARIYLDLFQPAARHIGELWADDRCSFVDVTLAIGTLQKMLRSFGPAFHRHGRPPAGDRQALLLPLPGDQHTFGLSMVTEFFRRAGWSVWNTPLACADEIGEAVRTAWFALVGFSASTDGRLEELKATIALVRRESCNRSVGIMVGGPIFFEHPEYVERVGADAFGENAVVALDRAEGFVVRSTAA